MGLKNKTSVQKKNKLICVGTIGSFGGLTLPKEREDGTVSKYVYEKVEIRPASGSVKIKFNLMWNPLFFVPGTTGDDIRREFSEFLYQKNIAHPKFSGGFLEGLCGDNEVYEQIEEALAALPEYTNESVHEVLDAFFSQQQSPFIYVLKQESKKTGEKDARGKDIYEDGEYYEVERIMHLTEKNVKSLVSEVKRNEEYRDKQAEAGKPVPAKLLFKFDPADYGLEIELPQTEPAWVG